MCPWANRTATEGGRSELKAYGYWLCVNHYSGYCIENVAFRIHCLIERVRVIIETKAIVVLYRRRVRLSRQGQVG